MRATNLSLAIVCTCIAATATATTNPKSRHTDTKLLSLKNEKSKKPCHSKPSFLPHGPSTNKCTSRIQTNTKQHAKLQQRMSQQQHQQSVSEAKKTTTTVSILRAGGDSDDDATTAVTLVQRLRIASYFALWYALNIVYNILNKKLLIVLPSPLTVAALQLGVGASYAALLWTLKLRASPKLNEKGRGMVRNVGFYHSTGQILSMVSLGAGPVSFTHIVKALEPFFSAVVSALIFGKWMKPQVYASLIPVVGGVAYACLKERSFSWLSFWSAMGSNLAFALRAVVSKSAMVNYVGDHITPANLFGLVTRAAFWISIPIAILGEGSSFLPLWTKATTPTTTPTSSQVTTSLELVRAVIVSGLFHYLNNEVMYFALGKVHPVTLAVGNTMKRVFIMVASVIVFQNPVSLQAAIGSAVGIAGVLLYSLTKQYYEKKEA